MTVSGKLCCVALPLCSVVVALLFSASHSSKVYRLVDWDTNAHLLETLVHPPRNELSSFLGGCTRVYKRCARDIPLGFTAVGLLK